MVDLSQWTGGLALTEVEEKPAKPLRVKYGSLELDELGKIFTPTQVRVPVCEMWMFLQGGEGTAVYLFFKDPPVS